MPEQDDHELLAEFGRSESESAFTTLVTRYVNLVYSAALRSTGNPHHASEITQVVFIILARKAGRLRRGTVLSGWLYQTARLTAANFLKREIRRQNREQEAYMQSILTEPDTADWEQLAPLLDEAMGGLAETDRNVVVLRFFENKTAAEAAAVLKTTEAAMQKRASRALGKLRKFFSGRGVTLSAGVIAAAISAGSVQAAPAGLSNTIVAVAITNGAAASVTTLTLIKGVLKIMAWSKAQPAVALGVALILTAATTDLLVKHQRQRRTNNQTQPALVAYRKSSPQGLQGHWTGSNTAHPGETCALTISGDKIEYLGAEPNDWIRGTFALNENTDPKQMNITILEPAHGFILCAYQMQDDRITIAAAEHGSSQRPVGFAPSRRVDVLEFDRD